MSRVFSSSSLTQFDFSFASQIFPLYLPRIGLIYAHIFSLWAMDVCAHTVYKHRHTLTHSLPLAIYLYLFFLLSFLLFSSPSSSSPRLRSVQKYTLFLLNFGKRLAGLGVFSFLLLIQRPRPSRFSCLFVRFPPFSSPLSHTPCHLLLLFCNHIIT